MQKVKKLSFFNFIRMSKRFFSGGKYFLLGIVSFLVLINLIDMLESVSIYCNGGVVPCALLVDFLIYVSLFLFLVGCFKLILFFWKDYKLIDKIQNFKLKYLNGNYKVKEKKEEIEGKCEMCGTINDVDAVFCKKCASSLKDEENQ
jgi:hypothetical protein